MLFPRRRSGGSSAPAAPPALCRFLAGASLAGVWALTAGIPADAVVIRQSEWPLTRFQANNIWDISEGQGVSIAVIDSGVDAAHPDLKGQVLQGAGFIGDPQDKGQTDVSGDSHGTAIAGIIAGTGKANHGNGMIGLAPKSKVLPVRVTADGNAEPTVIAEGIKYATDHHVQVINISIGTTTPDPLLREAVNYALDKDVVVVAAAGNEGQNGNPAMYPAAFSGVIDVTGMDSDGRFWPASESGPQSTLAAPATDIYSANDHGQYVRADGTSYAAGYVSAAAALVRSAFPHLTAGQTIRRLVTTAQLPGSGSHDNQFGYGVVDPLTALRAPATHNGSTANPLLSIHPVGKSAHTGIGWITSISVSSGAVALTAAAAWVVIRRRKAGSVKHPGLGPTRSRGTSHPSSKSAKKKHKSRA